MTIDDLTKADLVDLAHDLIYWQEKYYRMVVSNKLGANEAFYQLAGSFQVTRISKGLPELYEINKNINQ
jgi:hypothetical protein